MHTHSRLAATVVAVLALTGTSVLTGSAVLAGSTASGVPTPDAAAVAVAELGAEFGIQQVPKSAVGSTTPPAGPNPYLALLPDLTQVDMFGWRQYAAANGPVAAKERSAAVENGRAVAAPPPMLVDEAEPDQLMGGNDTPATAQLVARFGTASTRAPAARLLGTLATAPVSTRARFAEDNGAIGIASRLDLVRRESIRVPGVIGDGPHGRAAGGTGDFDFLRVSGQAGQTLTVDIDTPTGDLDSVVGLWSLGGRLLASNDDLDSVDSLLTARLPWTGTFYVSVAGFGSEFPADPFDPASGRGAGSQGPYEVTVGLDATDQDHYSFELRPGDTFAATVSDPATELVLWDVDRRRAIGSTQDSTFLYPGSSPLPGGGRVALAHVADQRGRYVLLVAGTGGNYDVTVEAYRSGLERPGGVQTVFVDFDGARVNTGLFGGPGVRTLSPLSGFLGRWGLRASDESRLIDAVLAQVTENLRADVRAAHPGADVRILNSREHPDPFGQKNVSRVVVGGTIAESGIDTIGIAQSIDPGNFETEETALVLLDVLSGTPRREGDATANFYLRPQSNRVRFVGQVIGNIVSHEVGHYIGNWHVDQFDGQANLMDQGGNFPVLYGVGRDRIGGTADDVDVDFGENAYNRGEGFTGTQDTLTTSAYGLTRG